MASFLSLRSTMTGYVSISAFNFLIGIPIDIASSAVVLNICVITVGIKKSKSIVEKKRKTTWQNSTVSKE